MEIDLPDVTPIDRRKAGVEARARSVAHGIGA